MLGVVTVVVGVIGMILGFTVTPELWGVIMLMLALIIGIGIFIYDQRQMSKQQELVHRWKEAHSSRAHVLEAVRASIGGKRLEILEKLIDEKKHFLPLYPIRGRADLVSVLPEIPSHTDVAALIYVRDHYLLQGDHLFSCYNFTPLLEDVVFPYWEKKEPVET